VIRLVLADDHQMVRQGFRRIIESHPDMALVAEASDGDELLALLPEARPDVLLLDISMPGCGFIPLMRVLSEEYEKLPVLVVSMHPEEHWAIRALKAGASGYLTKTHSAEELAEGIRQVHAGKKYITREMAEVLAGHFGKRRMPSAVESLSPREFEVLRALGSGKMVKTIARELGVSSKTVSTFRARIFEKLGVESTAELVRFAVEHDLVE
jgi:DNA-binding NarL/FixJ family response regulator